MGRGFVIFSIPSIHTEQFTISIVLLYITDDEDTALPNNILTALTHTKYAINEVMTCLIQGKIQFF